MRSNEIFGIKFSIEQTIYQTTLLQNFGQQVFNIEVQLSSYIFTTRSEMIDNTNIDDDSQNLSAEQIMSLKFSIPCLSSHETYLRVTGQFDPQTGQPIDGKEQRYVVNDSTTVEQLKLMWYRNNIVEDPQNQHSPEDFVLMYNLQFPLLPYETMLDIKKKVRTQTFDPNLLIRVYDQWICPYHKDQASYEKYEEQNIEQIQTPVKFRSKKFNNSCYFYIKTQLKAYIKDLKQGLDDYLSDKKSRVVCKNKKQLKYFGYTLKVRKSNLDTKQKTRLENIYKLLENNKIIFNKQDSQLDFTSLNEVKLRQIVPPGQIIYLEFQNQDDIEVNLSSQCQKDYPNPQIKIVCYEKQEELSNFKLSQSKSKIISRKEIKVSFGQVRDLKVSTFLNEQGIKEPLITSVCSQKITIKPSEQFKKLDQYIKGNEELSINLVTVPENLLFYKELAHLEKLKMQDILKHITQAQQKNPLSETNMQEPENSKLSLSKKIVNDELLKKCRNIRDKRRFKIEKQAYKHEDFLDPIILYTSPFIYSHFNKNLRKSIASEVHSTKIEQNLEKYWYYPFSQKLIKSLLKLPNTQGTFYRGSVEYNYNFKEGEIVQWNGFTSTSANKKMAFTFIRQQVKKLSIEKQVPQLTYLFQITAYSGKDIDKFSYYLNEAEILLLPYTKYKVTEISIQQEQNIKMTVVKLTEIPIPKKIPGNIVVWIDANITQNSTAFNQIIESCGFTDFDLIQLVSNEHFETWLHEFKHTLSLPGVKVHFITNMNRPPFPATDDPNPKPQGIHTLDIIRSFNPTAKVVYYIGNVARTKQTLTSYWERNNLKPDQNIELVQSFKGLKAIFTDVLSKV